ncbi:ANTAR domain-containing protein [Microcella alkalica]|uniref:ANTAR domain-containing protein n=1 Tax=Microcella alkalica TaxID=355930 RepID=UPI001C722BF2|nr:ANTAR domain-containing protein [Microcella alkalica]
MHRALDSRILIEQAKGMIAPSPSPSMDDAVTVLRAHASITNRTIRAFANAISARELEVSALQSRAPH